MFNNPSRFSSPWAGVTTALITPFKQNEEIDFGALFNLIDQQISGGIHGLVLCGSTAEAMSLSNEEYEDLLTRATNKINQRAKVIIGLSSNNLATCIERSNLAKNLGADAVLAVTPYYYKPTQSGMVSFFKQLSNSVDIPIILYNVPSRTSTDLQVDTTAQLAMAGGNIVALKDASGDLSRPYQLQQKLSEGGTETKGANENFSMLSGEDKTFVEFCTLGGCGVISVISNLYPKQMVEIYNLCKNGKYDQAAQLQAQLYSAMDAIFSVTNPVGIKFALSQSGMCGGTLRLPLQEADTATAKRITKGLQAASQKASR